MGRVVQRCPVDRPEGSRPELGVTAAAKTARQGTAVFAPTKVGVGESIGWAERISHPVRLRGSLRSLSLQGCGGYPWARKEKVKLVKKAIRWDKRQDKSKV